MDDTANSGTPLGGGDLSRGDPLFLHDVGRPALGGEADRHAARLEDNRPVKPAKSVEVMLSIIVDAINTLEKRIEALERNSHTHYYAPDDPLRQGDPNSPVDPIW